MHEHERGRNRVDTLSELRQHYLERRVARGVDVVAICERRDTGVLGIAQPLPCRDARLGLEHEGAFFVEAAADFFNDRLQVREELRLACRYVE